MSHTCDQHPSEATRGQGLRGDDDGGGAILNYFDGDVGVGFVWIYGRIEDARGGGVFRSTAPRGSQIIQGGTKNMDM